MNETDRHHEMLRVALNVLRDNPASLSLGERDWIAGTCKSIQLYDGESALPWHRLAAATVAMLDAPDDPATRAAWLAEYAEAPPMIFQRDDTGPTGAGEP